jgi:3-deoxy-manno-octulosonate cytidylyltransferase (CMP-KDO synthetase)
MSIKIAAIIPARMRSSRYPGKILLPIHGLPMIEHVRRRALLCKKFSEVVVATCDVEIADVVRKYSGNVVMTSEDHISGTTRVAEAVSSMDCSHVLLLQGDEPLLVPQHLESLIDFVINEPNIDVWNLVGSLESAGELERNSFVKCVIGNHNQILYCFRRTPSISSFEVQNKYIRKMLGVISYRKDFLLKLASMPSTPIEISESIEQMRIIENGFKLNYVEVNPSLPSINEPHELGEVLDYLNKNPEQIKLLKKILASE